MGTDIEYTVEVKVNGKWEMTDINVFNYRHYNMFAFLGGVRNVCELTPISSYRGVPEDISFEVTIDDYSGGGHNWILLSELLNFDYDTTFEYRRAIKVSKGPGFCMFSGAGETVPVGEGVMKTYREVLGEDFFSDIEKLKPLGEPENVRIIVWFDSF